MRPHHHRERSRQMMPLERTACIAVLLIVAFAMVFLS
jgi:hypothetical protein